MKNAGSLLLNLGIFELKTFEEFSNSVNLIFTLDHSGRNGNGFFQTIFDENSQVLSLPWLHYVYSYFINQFGDKEILTREDALSFINSNQYLQLFFRLKLTAANVDLLKRMGACQNVRLNRVLAKKSLNALIADQVSRKSLFLSIYYSIAVGLGRDTSSIKYFIMTDSISLRSENVLSGYKGLILDLVQRDFADFKFVHLIRDPRAGFASSVQQFTNQNGNSYAIRHENLGVSLNNLIKGKFDWDSSWVFGFWMLYFFQTFRAVQAASNRLNVQRITVKNEVLNLDFKSGTANLCSLLQIERSPRWNNGFTPTMFGKDWRGAGAYNPLYVRVDCPILKYDKSEDIARSAAPNKIVTTRWKTRLKGNEQKLVEILFGEELREYGYPYTLRKRARLYKFLYFLTMIWLPVSGEIPRFGWWIDIRSVTKKTGLFTRLILITFGPFLYVFWRLAFLYRLFQLKRI